VFPLFALTGYSRFGSNKAKTKTYRRNDMDDKRASFQQWSERCPICIALIEHPKKNEALKLKVVAAAAFDC